MRRDGKSQQRTAEIFGISKTTVRFIEHGRSWGWLD
jgi:DNA-binding XRE family transcriptional regulator